MGNIKQRIEKLENKQKPENQPVVIWQDPNNDEIFYDHSYSNPDRKQLSREKLEQLRSQDNKLIVVQYVDDWKGGKDREIIN